MRNLPRIVADTPVGKSVDVRVLRKGEEVNVKVTLGRLEDGEKLASVSPRDEVVPKSTAVTVLGITVDELNETTRKKFELSESVEGVVVTEVEVESAAAGKGLKAGDVIAEVGQEAVKTPADVKKRVEALKKEGRKNALLLIASKTGDLRFAVVRIE